MSRKKADRPRKPAEGRPSKREAPGARRGEAYGGPGHTICRNRECKLRLKGGCAGFTGCPGYKA
jgi:hypothetical protein